MSICKICDTTVKDFGNALPLHIRTHNITKQDYYVKYIAPKPNCEKCGADVAFINLSKGFEPLCNVCFKENTVLKVDAYWESDAGKLRRFALSLSQAGILNMGSGRPKGTKNKTVYKYTPSILARNEKYRGGSAPHNRDKCKATWANKTDEEISEIINKRMITECKNLELNYVEIVTPVKDQLKTNLALNSIFNVDDTYNTEYIDIEASILEFKSILGKV